MGNLRKALAITNVFELFGGRFGLDSVLAVQDRLGLVLVTLNFGLADTHHGLHGLEHFLQQLVFLLKFLEPRIDIVVGLRQGILCLPLFFLSFGLVLQHRFLERDCILLQGCVFFHQESVLQVDALEHIVGLS